MSPVGSTLIIVSWFPPDPPNGVLTSYMLRVLIEATGQEFHSSSVNVNQDEQQVLQTVNVGGLDLDNVGYRVFVSASTRAGSGPSSEPVLIGALGDGTMTPQTTPTQVVTTAVEAVSTNSATDDVTSPPTTDAPTTSLTTPTVLATPTSTPTMTVISRDDVYYIVRIVPPVVGGFIVVGMVLAIILCCVHRRVAHKKRKGLYQFPGSENDYR